MSDIIKKMNEQKKEYDARELTKDAAYILKEDDRKKETRIAALEFARGTDGAHKADGLIDAARDIENYINGL